MKTKTIVCSRCGKSAEVSATDHTGQCDVCLPPIRFTNGPADKMARLTEALRRAKMKRTETAVAAEAALKAAAAAEREVIEIQDAIMEMTK